jgi:hypothetical protein
MAAMALPSVVKTCSKRQCCVHLAAEKKRWNDVGSTGLCARRCERKTPREERAAVLKEEEVGMPIFQKVAIMAAALTASAAATTVDTDTSPTAPEPHKANNA